MRKMIEDRINGYGQILRFITPTMIAIIGYLSVTGIDDVRTDIKDLAKHFTNHLEHHQTLEVKYENRITSLENNKFTIEDSIKLEQKLRSDLSSEELKARIKTLEETLRARLKY